MSRWNFFALAALASMSQIACAHSVPVEGAEPEKGPVSTARDMAPPRDPVWTATIKSVPQTRFYSVDSTREIRGTAEWTLGDSPSESNANISVAYTGSERILSWAILFGGCGSATLSVIPRSSFPEVDVSGGTRGQATATLPLELPNSGSYHVDVYRDRNGGSESLVGCGNLRYTGASR